MTLIEARRKADQYRALISQGKDPCAEERRGSLTLGQAAEAYIERHKAGWRNTKTVQRWKRSFFDHAKELADRPLTAIAAADIKPVVDRLWRRDCGRELRFRLETIFRDNRTLLGPDHVNPATMDALGLARSRRKRGTIHHHPAMPYEELPGFMTRLRSARQRSRGRGGKYRPQTSSLALQLLILTATRTAEVLWAEWRILARRGGGGTALDAAGGTHQVACRAHHSAHQRHAGGAGTDSGGQGWPAVQPRPFRPAGRAQGNAGLLRVHRAWFPFDLR